jgi:two-component system, NarL family, response regulator DegU
MKEPLKLLVVDDHPIFLKGLIEVLQEELPKADLLAHKSSLSALASIKDRKPDIAILDLDMPEMNGLVLSAALRAEIPEIKIIMLTMHREPDIIRSIIAKGVDGYVIKDDAVIELVTAIAQVQKGLKYVSDPSVLNMKSTSIEIIQSLTKTECLVLKEIAEKRSSKEIAEALFISVKTVENHRSNISKKLQIKGSNSLLKFALENKEFI